MITLTDLIPPHKPATQEARLREAYIRIFAGKGSKDDADLVFLDLMVVSGYHHFLDAPAGAEAASDAALRELNGSRRVGGRIMRMLNYPLAQLNEIQAAIVRETEYVAAEPEERPY